MMIARLLMVLLVLTATSLSSAPKPHGRPGGSSLQTKTEASEFYCYSNPELVYSCFDEEWLCHQNCEEVCEGPCDWEYTLD